MKAWRVLLLAIGLASARLPLPPLHPGLRCSFPSINPQFFTQTIPQESSLRVAWSPVSPQWSRLHQQASRSARRCFPQRSRLTSDPASPSGSKKSPEVDTAGAPTLATSTSPRCHSRALASWSLHPKTSGIEAISSGKRSS